MLYHINAEQVSLKAVKKRIENTDLVPSRTLLLNDIDTRFTLLEKHGISSLAELRKDIENPKSIEKLSAATKIDTEYLNILRREIEGYFSKPIKIEKFDRFPMTVFEQLKKAGLTNTQKIFEKVSENDNMSALARSMDLDIETVKLLLQLSDLTRIQWVNHTFAKMLHDAGFMNPGMIAKADPVELHGHLSDINSNAKYFKGQIGLRDIKRVVQAASYVYEN
jgi:hypothetical protein